MANRRVTPTRKAIRSFAWLLAILAALAGLNLVSVLSNNGQWVPRLALDLEGGTQIILAPRLGEDQAAPNGDQMAQAVSIIRQRVDASGVSESEISTQGETNIAVAMPGEPDQATIDRLSASAQLSFRPVLQVGAGGVAQPSPTPTPGPDGTLPEPPSDEPATTPADSSDPAWITPALLDEFTYFDCTAERDASTVAADEPMVACDAPGSTTLQQKYILGPVEISGERVSDATAQIGTNAQGAATGGWVVAITFDGEGATRFSELSTRLFGLSGARNQFAMVLDGGVISAPTMNAVITNGEAQISGNFNQTTAQALADQLRFGALPFSFQIQSQENISATLGASQLQSGLVAGLIGLILVVLYSFLQYRALGIVTVASLVVAAAVTYLVVTLFSNQEGYRLSLAGVAGLVISVGITADSFIVYFERVKDELREGKALGASVEAGWARALRTITASDAVNFLAAIVLFFLAVGNVRGFALTLGITTVVDLIVVALFTHPMLQLLAKRKFFANGHRLSGLDPKALGAVYRGRAKFRPVAAGVSETKVKSSQREAAKRQSIAERKAQAEREGSTDFNASSKGGKR